MPSKLETFNDRYKEQYKTAVSATKWHGLIVGQKGAGKTWLIKTMPKPVFIFSFDPGGTDTLLKEKKAGDVIVEQYETDDFSNPHSYIDFQKDINEMGASGFLQQFASVVYDSLTLLQTCMIQHLLKINGRLIPESGYLNPTNHGMRQNDWGTVLTMMRLHVTQLHSLPCHTLMTGHISKERDEVNGGLVKMLNLGGQSKNHVPYMTSEVYYLVEKQDKKRELILSGAGEYEATTRLGSDGLLKDNMPPDLKALIVKAGLDASDKDWRP